MNIYLKQIEMSDGKEYSDLLMELSHYKDAYARPVPSDFSEEEFEDFKKNRIRMRNNDNLPDYVVPTSTYWVICDDKVIGYATLKHRIDVNKVGGHFGCCLKKDYQNKGIGNIVAELLSKIAYYDLGIEEVIYTAKNENIQSQKSIENIGGKLIGVHNGYHFYSVNIKDKYKLEGRNI